MKNIFFVASECMPFVKTGGLADVVGSLPKHLDKRYFDCRVILPLYSFMPQRFKDMLRYRTHFYMDYNWNNYYVGVLEMDYDGIHYYFIDNQDFFSCDKPYAGMPYDIYRYGFFCKAALSAMPNLGFRPDVIHCHDWQTSGQAGVQDRREPSQGRSRLLRRDHDRFPDLCRGDQDAVLRRRAGWSASRPRA